MSIVVLLTECLLCPAQKSKSLLVSENVTLTSFIKLPDFKILISSKCFAALTNLRYTWGKRRGMSISAAFAEIALK